MAALTAAPVPMVWLDELQRYLDHEDGLTGGVMRALLGPPHPAVIIATLWPRWHTPWTAPPGPDDSDVYARQREVLGLADDIRIGPDFSPAEQDRAQSAAARDRWRSLSAHPGTG